MSDAPLYLVGFIAPLLWHFDAVKGSGRPFHYFCSAIDSGELLSSFYTKMFTNILNYEELAVILVFTIALWVLISKLPPLISGIVTGSSIGSTAGIGSYSAGDLVAAAGTTAAITAYGVYLHYAEIALSRE
ncbi:hypothetical protein [Nitrosomonas aestuarii]|nr:hypothetical protein [Nitrosomonas aestuarii]